MNHLENTMGFLLALIILAGIAILVTLLVFLWQVITGWNQVDSSCINSCIEILNSAI